MALSSIGWSALAAEPWAVVERKGLANAVAEAEFTLDEINEIFDVVAMGPGAFRTGPVDQRRAGVVRRIGRMVNDQDGYSLMLIPSLDSREALPFDGLVIDRHRRIVANFSLRRQTCFTREASQQLVWNYRMSGHYQHLDGWAYRLMAKAAQLSHTNESEPSIVKLTTSQSQAFERFVADSRILVGTFVGEQPRPLWTLVDVPRPATLRATDVTRFVRLSEQNPGARIVLNHSDGSTQDFCAGQLR